MIKMTETLCESLMDIIVHFLRHIIVYFLRQECRRRCLYLYSVSNSETVPLQFFVLKCCTVVYLFDYGTLIGEIYCLIVHVSFARSTRYI